MSKIAITGSRKWENRLKLKDTIFKLKTKYKTDLTIISGGTGEGVDSLVKKYSLEFDLDYAEARPNHFDWSPYCIEPAYMYSREFKSNNYYIRNTKLIKEADAVLLFVTKDEISPVMKNIVQQCDKKCKKLIIITE